MVPAFDRSSHAAEVSRVKLHIHGEHQRIAQYRTEDQIRETEINSSSAPRASNLISRSTSERPFPSSVRSPFLPCWSRSIHGGEAMSTSSTTTRSLWTRACTGSLRSSPCDLVILDKRRGRHAAPPDRSSEGAFDATSPGDVNSHASGLGRMSRSALDRHCGWSCRPRAATTASSPASDLSPRIRPALIAYREVSHPADSPPERRPNSSQGVRFLPGARFAVAIGAFAVRRLVAVVGQAHFPPVSTSP
jgi:hypothetical protein